MSSIAPSPDPHADRAPDGAMAAPGLGLRGKGALLVAGIFVAILMGALDQFVVITALPNVVTDLGQSTGAAFVVSAYLISASVGIPVFGRLADIYSRRTVFLAGLAAFIGGSALAGLSQNLGELIAFRAVQGVASNAFIVVGFTIVAAEFAPALRARIAGLFTGTFVIATVVGPFLGSFLIDHASWRWIFYVNLPVSAVSVALLSGSLGASRPSRAGRFDIAGAALLGGWVAALTFALVQNSDSGWGWTEPRMLGLVIGGLALLVAFVAWELRNDEPLVPLRFFARPIVAASGSVSFLRGVALISLYTFLAVYVGLILAHGGSDASDRVRDVLYFLVVPAVVGAGLGSQIMLRVSYRAITGVGLGLAAIGCYFLTGVTAGTPPWQFTDGFLPTGGLILPLVPIGLGIGLTFPVTLLSAQFAVPNEHAGAATSIVQFLGTLGGAMGVSLLTSFQEWRYGLLAPAASPACAPGASPSAACLAYASAAQQAAFQSVQEVFVVILAVTVAAFLIALAMPGRLPTGAHPGAAA